MQEWSASTMVFIKFYLWGHFLMAMDKLEYLVVHKTLNILRNLQISKFLYVYQQFLEYRICIRIERLERLSL